MDPEKIKVNLWFHIKRFLTWLWSMVGWILLLIGFSFALSSFLRVASPLNVLILVFYIALLLYQVRTALVVKRRYGIVKDSMTNTVVPAVSIALYELEFNRLIQRRISNERGLFLLVVPGGRYKLEVAAVDWMVDYETAQKKGGYKGEEIIVKGEKTQALRVSIWVKKKSQS